MDLIVSIAFFHLFTLDIINACLDLVTPLITSKTTHGIPFM